MRSGHTRKHLGAIDQKKRVLILTGATEGMHDQRLLDETQIIAQTIPDEIPIGVDLGFQGLPNQVIHVHIPLKKPRGGSLGRTIKINTQRARGFLGWMPWIFVDGWVFISRVCA